MNTATIKGPAKVSVHFARFGITEQHFRELIEHFNKIHLTRPKIRGNDEMPFSDWEAAKLGRIFVNFHEDKDLCSLIAAMMQYIKDKPKPT